MTRRRGSHVSATLTARRRLHFLLPAIIFIICEAAGTRLPIKRFSINRRLPISSASSRKSSLQHHRQCSLDAAETLHTMETVLQCYTGRPLLKTTTEFNKNLIYNLRIPIRLYLVQLYIQIFERLLPQQT